MQPASSKTRLILILGIVNALTPFTIDLYLPAFGDIARDLGSTVAQVSLSVATYFVGFAIGQLIYGPLLDRFGRKPPVYFGLALYLLATIGCMTAHSVEALLVFRFLTAIGGSAASVASVTMVRDYFEAKEGARVFSMLMLVLSVSPLFAPTIGSWIAEGFGWRTIFGVLFGLALIDFALVAFGLPKVHQPDRTVSLRPRELFQGFVEVFRVQEFRSYTIAGALSFSGLFVYLTGSAGIFIDGFQLTKQQYGYVFAALAGAMIGAGQVNNLLLKRSTSGRIARVALTAQVFASLLFLVLSVSMPLGFWTVSAFLFVILGCVGFVYPNTAALSLSSFTRNAGRASSLMGFIQMGLGALLASVVGVMDAKGTLPIALVIGFSSTLAWFVLRRAPEVVLAEGQAGSAGPVH